MTGFSRVTSSGDWGQLTIESRSVNHRYLDLSVKCPELLRPYEQALRALATSILVRGKIEFRINYLPNIEQSSDLVLNHELIASLVRANQVVKEKLPTSKDISVGKILTWPNVVLENNLEGKSVEKPLMTAFSQAIEELNQQRALEGEKIHQLLLASIEQLTELVSRAQTVAKKRTKSYKEQLLARFKELSVEIDPLRVEAELVLLLQKLDVNEELDRLSAHAKEVKDSLVHGGRVGRRLDFLMQELNRESNTLSSKSVDIGLTNVAIELKVLIEQMREQIQNIA